MGGMSMWGASRFTALLAAVAISGMAGTFWWALETRSEMQAAVGTRGFNHPAPPKFGGRVGRKDDRPGRAEPVMADTGKIEPSGKTEPGTFELMGRSERPQSASPGSRSDGQEATAVLATYPVPGSSSVPPAQTRGVQIPSMQNLIAPGRGLSGPGLTTGVTSGGGMRGSIGPVSAAPGPTTPSSGSAGSRADMPLPALLALPPAQPEPPSPWRAIPESPVVLRTVPLPAAPPEMRKRQTRMARIPAAAAGARAAKPPAQSYYTEKFLDQSGEYRYRRRACEPPNMPDVCFMPQADRQPILVKP
jgi:hypothetical protein